MPSRHLPFRKRAFDLIIALPLAIVALPIVIAFASVLACQLRSWPFFVHDRVGSHGKRIRFPKLRTLPASTPRYADKTETTLRPVSRFAEWLRRLHLDELPQLALVLIGDLSLVGPRPLMVAEAARYASTGHSEWLARRQSIAQGCTGLWQVSPNQGRNVTDAPEYDDIYRELMSCRLDLWIIWRTAAQALGAAPTGPPAWAIPRASPIQDPTSVFLAAPQSQDKMVGATLAAPPSGGGLDEPRILQD